MVWVEFSDPTETDIVMCFTCSQDDSVYEELVEIDVSDARYKSYYVAISGSLIGVPEPTDIDGS